MFYNRFRSYYMSDVSDSDNYGSTTANVAEQQSAYSSMFDQIRQAESEIRTQRHQQHQQEQEMMEYIMRHDLYQRPNTGSLWSDDFLDIIKATAPSVTKDIVPEELFRMDDE